MTDCMVRGCSASTGSSLHYLPKDPQLRQKWVDFIYKNRVAPDCVDRIRICSIHFTEECFTNYRQKLMGFSKRLILRPTAVPTVDLQTDPGSALSQQEDTGSKESDTVIVWLCPLCQQGKRNRHTLALHLTKKHSVLPVCLKKLLDAAAPVSPFADDDGESDDGESDAGESSSQNTNGTSKQKISGKNIKPSSTASLKAQRFVAARDKEGSTRNKVVRDDMGRLSKKEGDLVGVVPVKNTKSSNKSSAEGDPFRCNACSESFPTQLALSAHSTSASHIQKLRTRAEKEDSMRAILRRYVSHRPYQCDVCNVAYNHAISLESHLKSVLHQTRARSAAKAAKAKSNSASRKVATKVPVSIAQLPTPLTPAQALSAYLPVLTFTPSAIVPSVFATPNSGSPQVLPQPQMLLVNGLQTKSSSLKPNKQAEDSSGSQKQLSDGVPISEESNPLVQGVAIKVEVEIKEEPCEQNVSQSTEGEMDFKREHNGVKCKEELEEASQNLEDNEKRVDTRNSEQDSKIGLGDSTSAKCSPSKMTTNTPILNEFQSQVLLAFLDSRIETNSGSPSRDECEALGREVGLAEDVVRMWFVHAWHSREVVGRETDHGQILSSSTAFLSEGEGGNEDQTVKGRKRKRTKIKGKPVCKKRGKACRRKR